MSLQLLFFSQIPLSPEKGVSFDDLRRIFGHQLLGCLCAVAAKSGMEWLLTRGPRMAEGLRVVDKCCEKRQLTVERRIRIHTSDAAQDDEVRELSQVDTVTPETETHHAYLPSVPDAT